MFDLSSLLLQDYGYEIMPYRSRNAYASLVSVYGGDTNWFSVTPVYKDFDGGSYTNCAMKSGGCGSWRVADGGTWWLRDSPYSEPNGDYTAYCWLTQYAWG